MPRGIHKIASWLYLGNKTAATMEAKGFLKETGITHIVNCVSDEIESVHMELTSDDEEELSEEQKTDFKEKFDLFDKDGKGVIDTKDIGTLMAQLGQKPDPARLEEDIDNCTDEATIEFEDFLELMQIQMVRSGDLKGVIEQDYTAEYLELELENTTDCDVGDAINEAYEFLSAAKAEKGIVLVHCDTGKSISPTILMGYMMKAKAAAGAEITIQQAKGVLEKATGLMFNNENFKSQLIGLERELFGRQDTRHFGGGKGGRKKGKGKRR